MTANDGHALGGLEGRSLTHVSAETSEPPFNARSETPQNDSTYLLASSGGFIQAFVYGLTGLRIEEAGLVEKFAPTLPKSLSYLRLVNLEFRGKALDVVISRLPSGRVVRRVTVKPVGH